MPVLRVALDLPLHRLFDYMAESASSADVGFRVRVPFGKGERIGVIVEVVDGSDWPVAQLKAAGEILRDLPPLPPDFFRLCEFASAYYQAALGEVIMQALPAGLKRVIAPVRRSGRAATSATACESAGTDGGAVRGAECHRPAGRIQRAFAPWRDRQRQDGGIPAPDRTHAGGRKTGVAAGAGNQPDATARRSGTGALSRKHGRVAAQRTGRSCPRAQLAGVVFRRSEHRARHPAGDFHAAAAPWTDRRRRGA